MKRRKTNMLFLEKAKQVSDKVLLFHLGLGDLIIVREF
jgi:hypothetical protein